MQTRPCWVEICTRALEDNYRFLASLAGPQVELSPSSRPMPMATLKLCAPAVVRAGAHWLGVTSVEEGIEARSVCPDAQILVIGGVFPGQGTDVVRHKLTPVVWEPWQFDELEAAASAADVRSIAVHLEIDTGMSRQGAILNRLRLFSHASISDSPLASRRRDDPSLCRRRSRRKSHRRSARPHGSAPQPHPRRWPSRRHAQRRQLGRLLAGQAHKIATLAARHEMKATDAPRPRALWTGPRVRSRLLRLRNPSPSATLAANFNPCSAGNRRSSACDPSQPGAVVGYNGTFVATEPMRLALVAAGYADGLDRKLGNRFSLLVRGQRAPARRPHQHGSVCHRRHRHSGCSRRRRSRHSRPPEETKPSPPSITPKPPAPSHGRSSRASVHAFRASRHRTSA